jgi:hypothetical protein
MAFGIRKPSWKKSLKARTTGKWKRQIKRKIFPWYGRKGIGWLLHPGRALYNWVYHRTTISAWSLLRKIFR